MKVDVYVCDRCASEHRNAKDLQRIVIRRGENGASPYELCSSCMRELNGWVKRGKTKPAAPAAETPAAA